MGLGVVPFLIYPIFEHMPFKKLLLLVLIIIGFDALATKQTAGIQYRFGGYGFVENKGQIIDQHQRPNKEVLYLFNGNGLHIQLRQNGFSYELIKSINYSAPAAPANIDALRNQQTPGTHDKDGTPDSMYMHRVDVLFAGCNKNISIIPGEAAASYINYYNTGNPAGISGVRHYQRVIYVNVYPGIDVEFVLGGDASRPFKYNFIVHPGANIHDIALQFLGAAYTALTDERSILIKTAYGDIEESIPYSFQSTPGGNRKEIEAHFSSLNTTGNKINSDLYGVESENYDASQILTIDPAPWATYFGGSGTEYGLGIAADASGNIVVSGQTASTVNLASTGAHQTTYGLNTDAFVAKFSNAGVLQWATYYGGGGTDLGNGIAVDLSGNIYMAGQTGSPTGMSTTGTYQPVKSGSFDAFVVKFNPAGVRQWGTYLGSSLSDWANGITVDLSGNVMITGVTASTSGIASTGAYQTVYGGGNNDAFIAKFDNAGSLTWSTYFGGSGQDNSFGIAIDLNGNLLVTGSTNSASGIASTGAYQTTRASTGTVYDAYVAKFNASGSMQWATYFGGTLADEAQGIIADGSGNLIIAGHTGSAAGIATAAAHQTLLGGLEDAFIAKFDPGGALSWST